MWIRAFGLMSSLVSIQLNIIGNNIHRIHFYWKASNISTIKISTIFLIYFFFRLFSNVAKKNIYVRIMSSTNDTPWSIFIRPQPTSFQSMLAPRCNNKSSVTFRIWTPQRETNGKAVRSHTLLRVHFFHHNIGLSICEKPNQLSVTTAYINNLVRVWRRCTKKA